MTTACKSDKVEQGRIQLNQMTFCLMALSKKMDD
jgi:hypothetical protein